MTPKQQHRLSTLAAEPDVDVQDEMIYDDLNQSWETGECVPVEDYVTAIPGLSLRRTVVSQLIRDEIRHRHQRGQSLSESEFVRRLPDFRNEVRDAFEDLAENPPLSEAEGVWFVGEPSIRLEGHRLKVRFRRLGLHDKGGLGLIYTAQDEEVRRKVALKEIRKELADDPESRKRFQIESSVTGRLEHPGIAPVYGLGQYPDGRPFYAMKFIEGDSLDKVIAVLHGQATSEPLRLPPPEPWTLRQLIARLISVCETLEYAHSQQVLHRDIKPHNLMLGRFGETVVIDWGLAKQLHQSHCDIFLETEVTQELHDARTDRTKAGSVVGSAIYMSPEQAAGNNEMLGPVADIYSVGATLYHMLTGQAPIQPTEAEKQLSPEQCFACLLEKVKSGKIARPRSIKPEVPKGLEAICLKAMAREARDRYQTARSLARDLQAWLDDQPVSALRETLIDQASRWARKHKGIVATSIVALVLLSIGSIVSAYIFNGLAARESAAKIEESKARESEAIFRSLAEENEALAIAERDKAIAQRKRAERMYYISQLDAAEQSEGDGNIGAAEQFLRNCSEELRGWEYGFINSRINVLYPTIESASASSLYCVAFSPDGTRLASGGENRSLTIWDLTTGKAVQLLEGHTGAVHCVAYSPDGRWIVSGSQDATLKTWDAITGQQKSTFSGHTGPVTSVVFRPDGNQIVSGSEDRTLKIWSTSTGQEVNTLSGHSDVVTSVANDPDGIRLVSGSRDETLRVWDGTSGHEVHTLALNVGPILSIAYSPDGSRIVSGSGEMSLVEATLFLGERNLNAVPHRYGTLKVWNSITGQLILTLPGHKGGINGVAFSPDGTRIVSGSRDNTLKVWDAVSGRELRTLRGHSGVVTNVAFSPDGTRIVSVGGDKRMRIWDGINIPKALTLTGHAEYIDCVAFSPDGRRIASGSWDNTLKVWDVVKGSEVLTIDEQTSNAESVAFSPDGTRLVSCSNEGLFNDKGALYVWDGQTGSKICTLVGHKGPTKCVAFSPDGSRIASGSLDRSVKVWDATTGDEIRTLQGHIGPVGSVAFSPDGTRIVSGSDDNTLKTWDAITGLVVQTLAGHTSYVESVAFSPDGTRIASGSRDTTLKVWDAATGAEILTLKGHTDRIRSVAFSPDGTRIVSGSNDNTLKVWDAHTGLEVRNLAGHTSYVTNVAFSRDGTRIVSSSWDKTLKVWGCTAGEKLQRAPIERFDLKSGRTLTGIGGGDTTLWRLHGSHYDFFAPRWHINEAASAERLSNWYAAAFHLSYLINENTNDASLVVRWHAALSRLPEATANRLRNLAP